MGLDLKNISTKSIPLNDENLAVLKTRVRAGVVLVEMYNQVSVVMEFERSADAKAFFGKLKV